MATLIDAEYWVKYNRWVKVNSSNVLAIRYDKDLGILKVQFKGKAKGIRFPIYKYEVNEQTAKEMYVAQSHGKFVWQRLRDHAPTSGPF